MSKHQFFQSSFERSSFLFGSDLLPAVYIPGALERVSLFDTRPSDMPRFIGSDGKPHHLRGWTAYRSTPDDHQRWLAEGHNAVLHTRRIYGLRIPADRVEEFKEHTSIEPIVVREGVRSGVVVLFRLSLDGTPSSLLVDLPPRVMVEPRGFNNRLIAGTADPIEFLGYGSSVLVCGTAANGSSVVMSGLQQMNVPIAQLDALERFWRALGDAYFPAGDGHPALTPPIVDPRERLGRFVFAQCMRDMPPRAAMFLGWMAGNGKLVGFDSLTALVLCPWHRHIKTKASHLPARFDMLSGEMTCPHPTCQRLGRTRADFELEYTNHFGMALL